MPDSKESSQAYVDRIVARAYSRATEVPERVKESILHLFPEETRELLLFTETQTLGHSRTPIIIQEGLLKDRKNCRKSVEYLVSKLTEGELNHLQNTLDRRIDEECTFFLRIDKQAAYLGRIELAQVTDVISLQFHIRKMPSCSPEDAMELIHQIFSLKGVSER